MEFVAVYRFSDIVSTDWELLKLCMGIEFVPHRKAIHVIIETGRLIIFKDMTVVRFDKRKDHIHRQQCMGEMHTFWHMQRRD
jgi:hypothetical protein